MTEFVLYKGKVYTIPSTTFRQRGKNELIVLFAFPLTGDLHNYPVAFIHELTPIDPLEAFAILSKQQEQTS